MENTNYENKTDSKNSSEQPKPQQFTNSVPQPEPTQKSQDLNPNNPLLKTSWFRLAISLSVFVILLVTLGYFFQTGKLSGIFHKNSDNQSTNDDVTGMVFLDDSKFYYTDIQGNSPEIIIDTESEYQYLDVSKISLDNKKLIYKDQSKNLLHIYTFSTEEDKVIPTTEVCGEQVMHAIWGQDNNVYIDCARFVYKYDPSDNSIKLEFDYYMGEEEGDKGILWTALDRVTTDEQYLFRAQGGEDQTSSQEFYVYSPQKQAFLPAFKGMPINLSPDTKYAISSIYNANSAANDYFNNFN